METLGLYLLVLVGVEVAQQLVVGAVDKDRGVVVGFLTGREAVRADRLPGIGDTPADKAGIAGRRDSTTAEALRVSGMASSRCRRRGAE
jgi:hypothetical protein